MVRTRLLALLLVLEGVQSGDLKFAALPGLDLVDVQPVKLLKSTALTLHDEEIDDKGTDEHAAGENVSVGKVDGAGDEGSEETDQEVPGPVGSNGQSHTLGTVLGGVQLGGDGPDHGSPGHGVSGNEEASEHNHTLADAGGVLGLGDVEHEVTDRSEDHEADEHPQGSEDQGLATTEVLNGVQTTEGASEVDSTQNALSNEAVGQTGTLEDGGTL